MLLQLGLLSALLRRLHRLAHLAAPATLPHRRLLLEGYLLLPCRLLAPRLLWPRRLLWPCRLLLPRRLLLTPRRLLSARLSRALRLLLTLHLLATAHLLGALTRLLGAIRPMLPPALRLLLLGSRCQLLALLRR